MTATWRMLSGAAAVALGLSVAASSMAQETPRATNDPAVGGQLNQCWGQVASQTAQMGGDDNIPGGGLGSHSRSTTAANNVGGFASDNNDFDITLNEVNAEGNHGRDGVGNVSAGPIHNTNPGDGGNGQHAINNGNLAAALDPVDGQGAGEQIPCDVP
jgi:hypothetical protein